MENTQTELPPIRTSFKNNVDVDCRPTASEMEDRQILEENKTVELGIRFPNLYAMAVGKGRCASIVASLDEILGPSI